MSATPAGVGSSGTAAALTLNGGGLAMSRNISGRVVRSDVSNRQRAFRDIRKRARRPEAEVKMMKRIRSIRTAVVVAIALLSAAAASAQEVRVVTSGGFTEAYKQLAPQFERETKIKVISGFGASMGATPDAIPNRLARGEAIDVIILATPGLDELTKQGKIEPGSRVDLIRSLIAMAVRNGTPKPDISTVEGL